jgi:hypothetical protein
MGAADNRVLAMVILIVAILIAAVSDSLEDRRAWLLATIIGAAYIVSRGIAKAGSDHARFTKAGPRRP